MIYASLWAGLAYFVIVFTIGFALGALRVLVVVPRTGELIAVLIEIPLMLAAAWMICAALIARFRVASRLLARCVMGVGAFALLIASEACLSICAFGMSVESVFATYSTPHGLVGLGGQVLFATFPLLQLRSW